MPGPTNSANATDEAGATPTPDVVQEKPKADVRRGFLSSAMRDLSEEELDSAAARRFLIAEIQRLDSECDDSKKLLSEHHDLRVENAQLREKGKRLKTLDTLSFVSTSAGSAGLGAASGYMTIADAAQVGWAFIIISAVLVVTGIFCRVVS